MYVRSFPVAGNFFIPPVAGPRPLEVAVDAGAAIQADFGMPPRSGTVGIYAYDRDGYPLSGVQIDLHSAEGFPTGQSAVANAIGYVAFQQIPAGRYRTKARIARDKLGSSSAFEIGTDEDEVFDVSFPDVAYGEVLFVMPWDIDLEACGIERQHGGRVLPPQSPASIARDVDIVTEGQTTTISCMLPPGKYVASLPDGSRQIFSVVPDRTTEVNLSHGFLIDLE